MNIFRKPRAQNLSEWLEIATENLAPSARERISADITSHYDQAVHGHEQNGLPRPAAEAAALAELGDAKAAARRFRRAHLTESEFRHVTELATYARNWTTLPFELALGFGYWGAVYDDAVVGPCSKILVTVIFAPLLVGRIALFAVARRNSADPVPRLFVLIASLLSLNLGILSMYVCGVCDIGLHPQSPEDWIKLAIGVAFSPVMFACSLSFFRLRNKLGKVAEDWMGEAGAGRKEIPPDNPIAS